jgi:small subunit ribosomal protein S8e
LVRTNTLVKGAIVEIEAVPHRQWYERYFGTQLAKKKDEAAAAEGEKSKYYLEKMESRKAKSVLEPELASQLVSGRVLARISSRPGQSGRADGYILEGKELEFYQRKLRNKKA